RKDSHETGEGVKADIDPKELVCEEDPTDSANRLRRGSSHATQVPSQVGPKQDAQGTEQLKAKNNLGVREAVTSWEAQGGRLPRRLPKSHQAIGVSGGSHKEQNTGDPVEHRCFHRSFS